MDSKSAVATSFTVRRWDAGATAWAAARLGRDVKAGNVTVQDHSQSPLEESARAGDAHRGRRRLGHGQG